MAQQIQLPDGNIVEFPDDATNEDISAALNEYVPAQQEGVPSLSQRAIEAAAPYIRGAGPTASAALAGAAIGTALPFITPPVGAGLMAIAAEATQVLGDPAVLVLNKYLGTDYTPPSQTIQSFLSSIGLPESKTQEAKLTEAMARGTAGALATRGLGTAIKGLTQAATGERSVAAEVGRMLADQPGRQAVAGATGGAASEATRQALEGKQAPEWMKEYIFPVLEMGAGMVGGAGGSYLAGKTQAATSMRSGTYPGAPGLTPEQTALGVQELEAKGQQIPTSYLFPPKGPVGKTLQRLARAGTAGELDQELIAFRNQEIENFFADKGIIPGQASLAKVTEDLNATRTANVRRLSGINDEIIKDADKTIKTVPVQKSLDAIDKEIEKLKKKYPTDHVEITSKLEKIKDGLAGPPIKPPVLLDQFGNEINRKPIRQGQSFSSVDANRNKVGSMTRDPSLAAIGAEELKKISTKLYGVIKDDMRNFLKDNKLKADLWDSTTAELYESAGQLDVSGLRHILNMGDVQPEAASRLLFSAKPSEVKLVYDNLSPEGKRNAQYAMLEKALSDSINQTTLEPSAALVEKRLNQLKKDSNIFFKNTLQKDEIEGLTRMLRLTSPAVELQADPATGQRAVAPMAAMAALAGQGAVKTITAATLLDRVASFYESPVARKILKAIPKAPKDSPEEFALTKRFMNAFEIHNDQKSVEDLEKKRIAMAFLPDNTTNEQMPNGSFIKVDNSLGYKMIKPANGGIKLFDKTGTQVPGIFANEKTAIQKATNLTYREVIQQIRAKEKAYASE
jgi:hypothetical protein